MHDTSWERGKSIIVEMSDLEMRVLSDLVVRVLACDISAEKDQSNTLTCAIAFERDVISERLNSVNREEQLRFS